MHSPFSEDLLVEQPAIELLVSLGWETTYSRHEVLDPGCTLGHEEQSNVVLVRRLRTALERLNPDLPTVATDAAIEDLTPDRGTMSLVQTNHEVYDIFKVYVPA